MVNVFWFRRDLRLHDNHGLFECLKAGLPVVPIFIFDKNILEELKTGPGTRDKRLVFIHRALVKINDQLREYGSSLLIFYDTPEDAIRQLTEKYKIRQLFTNRDYEPYGMDRDAKIQRLLSEKGIGFADFKDQVIFERNEVVKDDGSPYVVFTPYSRRWKAALRKEALSSYGSEDLRYNFLEVPYSVLPELAAMGFEDMNVEFPPGQVEKTLMKLYGEQRDYPAVNGTSRLGVHLRFGTISIRKLVSQAVEHSADTYLNELIWREFYMMILWHFPRVVDHSFRPAYDHIPWRTDEADFELWCQGKTGYPLVDAGMRELIATGYMHNRVRMVTASFLTKHLLIDWRMGEAWFARHLLDYELASNNGGWQWAAGSGCDAAPYFRIFNPEAQMKKFDKAGSYIKKWVPEWNTPDYPSPMVDHKWARERTLSVYKSALADK